MNLSPSPIQKFFDNDGNPLDGGQLFTYAAGTSTKVATAVDSAGTLNPNPILLDFRGECRLWIDPRLAYKYTLAPRTDSDPPTHAFWTVDNITAGPANSDNAAVDTGSVNNIALAIPQISAPVAFTRIVFKVANTNTGATTITINGGTAKALTWQSSIALAGGEIVAGGEYQAIYDGARWQLQGPTLNLGDVRLYGAVGDGVTDDTAAIQRAIDAVGISGEVLFPARGIFLCAGSLTGLNFQTWRGASLEIGAGGSQAALKCSKTSGTFITTGSSPRFQNLRFLGVLVYTDATGAVSGSTCLAMKLTDHASFEDCVWQLQHTCFENDGADCTYMRVRGGEVVRCSTWFNMFGGDPFNFEIDGTIFRLCNQAITSNDTPRRYVHNLKVMGGSFESYTSLFNYLRTASFFGTYFESDLTGGFAFNGDSGFVANDTSLSLFGCVIFINNLNRFINYSGLVGGTLVSIGNTIACSLNTGQNQYYFVPQNVNTGRTVMLGDYLDDRGSGTFQGLYTSDDTKLVNQMILWPKGTTANHSKAGQTWLDGGVIFKPSTLANSATPSVKSGTNWLTGGTTTITNFTNGVEGQTICVLAEHTITITDGTNIFLSGSVNFAMNSTDTLSLICKADGKWYEVGRSDNT